MKTTAVILALCLLASAAHAHSSGDHVAHVARLAALPAAPLGQGDNRFVVKPGWAKLPAGKSLASTHGGVAIDKAGNVYMSSDGPEGIFVFSRDGELIRTMAQGVTNLHGLVLRADEDGREFLYGALNKAGKAVKLTLEGEVVWEITVPLESGVYNPPEDPAKKSEKFMPTSIAVAPDGRVYVADGYGASVIHVFAPDRKYLKTIGTRGTGDNQFRTCHGLAIDTRFSPARLAVADRENRRVVHLDFEGNWLGVVANDLRRPCSVAFHGDLMAVAELEGRVVILDKAGGIVSTLGDNPDREQWAKFRLAPEFWRDGIFVAPHGLTFDAEGNLFVQEWSASGRLTKLRPTTAADAKTLAALLTRD